MAASREETNVKAAARRSWNRLDGVDLLRAAAILFMLANHVNMQLLFAKVHYLQLLPPQLGYDVAWNGQRGVQMFFAVSGFLITATSLRRWGKLGALGVRDFYVLRFARIAPLLLALLAVLSMLHLAHVEHFVVSHKVGGLRQALLAALTFRVNVFEATRAYLPGNWDILWSLSVEETFYLFFPLVSRILGRKWWLLVPVLLAFVVMGPFARTVWTHGNEVWEEYSYLGAMDAIAMGCLTALAMHGRTVPRRVLAAFGVLGALLLGLCFGFSRLANEWGVSRNGLGMTWVALGTCLLIVVAEQTQWQAPRWVSPVLAMGRRSYEVYLTHMFVVLGAFALFVRAGKPMKLVPLLFVSVFVLAGVLGDFVARLYSEPMNRWLRRRTGEGRLGSVVAKGEAVVAL